MSVREEKWMEGDIANLMLSKYATNSWQYVLLQITRTMVWRRIVAAKWVQPGPESFATPATSKTNW